MKHERMAMMDESFGQYLRRLRKKRGVSLRTFADALGVDFTYISKIENDKVATPSEKLIDAMAELLDVDAEEMKYTACVVSTRLLTLRMQLSPSYRRMLILLQYGNLSDGQIDAMLRVVGA
jgi:transcriptional regulator with XRE-family HTH domain